MIFIALTSILAWCGTIIKITMLNMFMIPILVFGTSLNILVTHRQQQILQVNSSQLLIYHSAMTSLLLLPFMFFFSSDKFNKDMIGIATSFELIDYGILATAAIFMSAMTISRYWLIGNCSNEVYLVYRQTKFMIACYGQSFISNWVHVQPIAIGGAISETSALLYYFYIRRKERNLKNLANGPAII